MESAPPDVDKDADLPQCDYISFKLIAGRKKTVPVAAGAGSRLAAGSSIAALHRTLREGPNEMSVSSAPSGAGSPDATFVLQHLSGTIAQICDDVRMWTHAGHFLGLMTK